MNNRFHRHSLILFPVLQTLWILWIASVGVPHWLPLILFFILSIALHGFFSMAQAIQKKRSHWVIPGLLINAIIVILCLLFTNEKTGLLAIVGLALILLYFIFQRWSPKLSLCFYAATWAWLAPLAHSAQGKDIEVSTWITFICIFTWTLLWQTMHQLRNQEGPHKLLGIACLMTINFAFFLGMGIFTGQCARYFVALLILLAVNIFQLDLLKKEHTEQGALYYLIIAGLISISIALSYPFYSNSRISKSALLAPQSGQTQVSGTSAHAVPGATPLSGSPKASS